MVWNITSASPRLNYARLRKKSGWQREILAHLVYHKHVIYAETLKPLKDSIQLTSSSLSEDSPSLALIISLWFSSCLWWGAGISIFTLLEGCKLSISRRFLSYSICLPCISCHKLSWFKWEDDLQDHQIMTYSLEHMY